MSLFVSLVSVVALLGAGSDAYAVVGAKGGVQANGARPARQDIFQMQSAGGPAWDLYNLCMSQIQTRPETQQTSWFEISAIHGRPYTSWDGVGGGNTNAGYCPHSSILFPTWHRPYLALLEQELSACATHLASQYPSNVRASYVSAATNLRLGYWDWMLHPNIPQFMTSKTIAVNGPKGSQTINNPLYRYFFHPYPSADDFPRGDAPTQYQNFTVRDPTWNSQGQSNTGEANKLLTNDAGYLHDATYTLLTRDTDYACFSNVGYSGNSAGCYGSLEGPHGVIHNDVGGANGYMTYLDYSAFDPIFYLHHVNVDRLFAIWQALNPNSWDVSQLDSSGTYSIPANTVENADTPLGPFHKDNSGNMWTSNTVRSTQTFGYTYPEITDWNKSADQLTADVRAAVRSLYDPNGTLGRRRHARELPVAARGVGDFGGTTAPLDPSSVVKNGSYLQWTANMRVNRFSLDDSFAISFFIGNPANAADSSTWSDDPAFVARQPVLRTKPGVHIDQVGMVYFAVPFTRALLSYVETNQLGGLDEGEIRAFLLKNLSWHIADQQGNVVDAATLDTLKVYVVSQVVEPPKTAADFPKYGTISVHREITQGKAGGLQPGDPL